MPITLSDHQIRLLRIRAQRLIPQHDQATPAQVLEAVCGVQAQEAAAALLAMRARSDHLTMDEIEQARQQQRSIIRTWAMRGTLHLLAAADACWLVPLLGPGMIAGDQRRMAELGWDANRTARGLRLLRDAVEGGAALIRAEIAEMLKKAGLPGEGQAPVHLIFRATWEGILCQGADRSKESTYASFERWAGPPQPIPREEALARLARRYLGAYAPASQEDFAAWAGLKSGDARLAWEAAQPDSEDFETGQEPLRMLSCQLPWLEELPAQPRIVRLLPRYDTYLLGYANRGILYDPAFAKRINAGGGIIHPTLMVDGRILGTWKASTRRGVIEVTVAPFEALPGDLIPEIEKEAGAVARFQGKQGILKLELP